VLFIVGASIFGALGLVHLAYTFFTDKFNPHNPDVAEAMKSTSPTLTKETTVWRAWVGFNASHSLGVILFSALYIPLAFSHINIIEDNNWFAALPSITGFLYLFLAKKYWFKVPFLGILMATICFVIAFVEINT